MERERCDQLLALYSPPSAGRSALRRYLDRHGSNPEFPEVPSGFTAQQLPDPHVGKGGFLDMFGRPERESACECERRNNMTLPRL